MTSRLRGSRNLPGLSVSFRHKCYVPENEREVGKVLGLLKRPSLNVIQPQLDRLLFCRNYLFHTIHLLLKLVCVAGFEPAAVRVQGGYSGQTELHADKILGKFTHHNKRIHLERRNHLIFNSSSVAASGDAGR